MSTEKRLLALEDHHRPVSSQAMTDRDREWYLGLCASPWVETVWQFAELLAERRCLHEGGFPVGSRSGWAGDWREAIPADERDALVQAEYGRVAELAKLQGNDDDALDEWLATADREGWPPLGGVVFSMDRQNFEAMVQCRRASIDISRGADMLGSPPWRRDHPQWRLGMTGDEAVMFEIELLAEADRLRVEWFGTDESGDGF